MTKSWFNSIFVRFKHFVRPNMASRAWQVGATFIQTSVIKLMLGLRLSRSYLDHTNVYFKFK